MIDAGHNNLRIFVSLNLYSFWNNLNQFLRSLFKFIRVSLIHSCFRKVNLYLIQRLNHKELSYNIVLINIFLSCESIWLQKNVTQTRVTKNITSGRNAWWSFINTTFSQSLFSTERLDDSFQELDLVITFGYLFLHPSELLHVQLENLWNKQSRFINSNQRTWNQNWCIDYKTRALIIPKYTYLWCFRALLWPHGHVIQQLFERTQLGVSQSEHEQQR